MFSSADPKYQISNNDNKLLQLFADESNMTYKINYRPAQQSLKTLHARMVSLCDEIGITITNVVDKQWKLVYYMKASGIYASLTFNYNKKGSINYGSPLSDFGQDDVKLQQLIDKLKQ